MESEPRGQESEPAADSGAKVVQKTAQKMPKPGLPPAPRRAYSTKQIVESRILTAILLFSFGGYFLLTSTSHESLQPTFNLQPGLLHGVPLTLPTGSVISGDFREDSGNRVTLYIMNSAEWASVQNGNYTGSLYRQPDIVAGAFTYTTQRVDVFYIVFDHGSGLASTPETVTVTLDYTIPHPTTEGFGLLSVALGGFSTFVALRRWRRAREQAP